MSRPHRDTTVPKSQMCILTQTYVCTCPDLTHICLLMCTQLTCHTCNARSHLHSHAIQPPALLVPLAHIHACRAHLHFQASHTSTSSWCTHLDTRTPFRCTECTPESVLIQHTSKEHLCVHFLTSQQPRPAYRAPLPALLPLHQGHWSGFAQRANCLQIVPLPWIHSCIFHKFYWGHPGMLP